LFGRCTKLLKILMKKLYHNNLNNTFYYTYIIIKLKSITFLHSGINLIHKSMSLNTTIKIACGGRINFKYNKE